MGSGRAVAAQADVPSALLRLRDAAMEITPYVNTLSRELASTRGVSMPVSDIARFGSALLHEELEDGRRVLVWTE